MQKKKDIDLEKSSRFRYFDWEKSKTFYYVSKLGSFTNASRFLHLSQPALSRQISSLEKQLGYPLFSRQSRGLTLTRKGEQLVSIIERTFLEIKGFINDPYENIENGNRRKIRIATTHALATHVLSDFVFDYSKQNPHLRFELLGDDHLIDVILNDLDIAIRPIEEHIDGSTFSQKNVEQEYLFSLEKSLYASFGYLEKYGEPQTVEDLKNHRIIAFGHPEEHPYADINWILRLGMPEGKIREPDFTSNSIECMIEAAKHDIGIVANYKEMKIVREANLKNILPDIKGKEIKEYIIYPDYLKEDQEILKIKEYLKEKIHELNQP
jgi:DNA-binding transcriptional LysR family regulator